MLVLTRKPGQSIMIEPDATLDLRTPIGELFRAGPIEVVVTHVNHLQVKVGIHAHPRLQILREELVREKHPTRRDRFRRNCRSATGD